MAEKRKTLTKDMLSTLIPVLIGVISGGIGAFTTSKVTVAQQQDQLNSLKDMNEHQLEWLKQLSSGQKQDHDELVTLRTRVNYVENHH